jgi:hypothetical protein
MKNRFSRPQTQMTITDGVMKTIKEEVEIIDVKQNVPMPSVEIPYAENYNQKEKWRNRRTSR